MILTVVESRHGKMDEREGGEYLWLVKKGEERGKSVVGARIVKRMKREKGKKYVDGGGRREG